MKLTALAFLLIQLSATLCFSQTKMIDKIKVAYTEKDFSVVELNNKAWKQASEVLIDKYWSGENAPVGRQFRTKLLWSKNALYIRFEANQSEPLIISESANLKTKTRGLWDRDVCEIFLAPNKSEPRKYFEFEIAPNGEWIDLGIHQKPNERITDWNYNSGMKLKAVIEKDKVIMAIKVDWEAFGKTPKSGDVWLGNVFRCVGAGNTRGYLAWSPTFTKEASFHVPEKFGEFIFE